MSSDAEDAKGNKQYGEALDNYCMSRRTHIHVERRLILSMLHCSAELIMPISSGCGGRQNSESDAAAGKGEIGDIWQRP